MINLKKYEPKDKMIDIISDNYNLLQVMCRFGISLGFGDKSVEEVCIVNDVNCRTFLAVINYMASDYTYIDGDVDKLSVPTLLKYLKASHVYYLGFELPSIREELVDGLDPDNHLSKLIMKFYDEYTREIRKHMNYEEKTIFPYVEGLLNNLKDPNYDIEIFSKYHVHADQNLSELKNVIIKYLPNNSLKNNKLTATLYSIYANEEWLRAHEYVESNIFIPVIRNLEENVCSMNDIISVKDLEIDNSNDVRLETLSDREKEVVISVVSGLTNKEIAEKLFISVHTVMTHRRNIARKLQIHSPAGLTIYAIVNHLVDISSVKI